MTRPKTLKAVIMGGGQGSRLRPLTCQLPKPLVPVCNKPVMGYCLDLLRRHGVTHVYVTLHYLADEVIAHFGSGSEFDMRMHYNVEQEPLGTAGSVGLLRDLLDNTFFVLSGDALTDCDLQAALEFHKKNAAKATLILTRVTNPLEFGVVITEDDGRVVRFLEKPTWGEVFSDTINTGIYIIEPEVLGLIPSGAAFDFSQDLFPSMLKNNMPIYGYIAEGYWCDVGSLEKYQEANLDLMSGKVNLEVPGTMLRRGIYVGKGTRIHPDAHLEAPLVIGKNCRIREGASLLEGTVLGDDCIVEEGASLHRDVVWEDTFIGRMAQSQGSIIGRKATIKANAVLGEGSVVGDDVTIGEGATVHPRVKIWPKKNVEPGGNVSLSLVWGQRWPSSMFGRDGITGLGNIEITSEFALKLGAAYGSVLTKGSTVTVSRESHAACRMINRSLICGLISVGIDVQDLRVIPAPVGRFTLRNTAVVGGIHCRLEKADLSNLQIQFFDDRGVNISKAVERKIESSFFREEFRRTLMDEVGKIDFPGRALELYTENFISKLELSLLRQAGFKVVVDYASGGSSTVLTQILGRIGCETVSLNAHLDPVRARELPFNSNLRINQLCEIVKTLKADLGVVFDPDGERMVLVDDKGEAIDGATILLLMTVLISQTERGTLVAAPVSAPSAIEKILEPTGGRVIRTGVDLRSLMHRSQLGRDRIRLAGTAEGELLQPDVSSGFDAMFCFVKLLELMARHKVSLSEVRSVTPKVHQIKRELSCSALEKGRLMRRLLKEMKNRELEMTDGLKIIYPGGWVLVVPSPSRPSLMLWSEGQTATQAEELIEEISKTISKLMDTPCPRDELLSVTPSLTHQNPTLPEEKAFHFWNAQRYLGAKARTLSEFLDTIHYIEMSSLTYHLKRGDFSNWIEHELHDQWLAEQIRMIETDSDRQESVRSSLVQTIGQSIHHRRGDEIAQSVGSEKAN